MITIFVGPAFRLRRAGRLMVLLEIIDISASIAMAASRPLTSIAIFGFETDGRVGLARSRSRMPMRARDDYGENGMIDDASITAEPGATAASISSEMASPVLMRISRHRPINRCQPTAMTGAK